MKLSILKIFTVVFLISCSFRSKVTLDSQFVKIKLYNKNKKEYLTGFKLVTSCNPRDEPYWRLDERKGFTTESDSIILNKKQLFAVINSNSCSPFNPFVVIMKDRKYFVFEIFESTSDTTYFAEW